jgi:hypothetical protein
MTLTQNRSPHCAGLQRVDEIKNGQGIGIMPA